MSTEQTGSARAVAALVAMRVIYAVNWLNVGAVFYSMESDLGTGVLGLGTLTSAFYFGLVLLQVPGGIMAAKWGPRKVVVLGTLLSSACALASGAAPGLDAIVFLRFLVGAGMALVFAPAVVMIARFMKSGSFGLGVGLFNSAFSVGGILALFAWGVLAELTGWRLSLEIAGGLGIASGLVVIATTRDTEGDLQFRVRGQQLWRVLGDSKLLLIGLGMLATDIMNGLVASFMNYYLVGTIGLGTALAGGIASMVVVVPIFSSLYAGRMYDRVKRPKLLLAVGNMVGAASLVICAYPTLLAALAASSLAGLATGFCFTVGFASAKDYNRAGKEYDGLSLAWVNCISLAGVVFPPLIFSSVVNSSGYPSAWLAGGVLTALFTVPLVFLRHGPGETDGATTSQLM